MVVPETLPAKGEGGAKALEGEGWGLRPGLRLLAARLELRDVFLVP
jgi:hypothetical protein